MCVRVQVCVCVFVCVLRQLLLVAPVRLTRGTTQTKHHCFVFFHTCTHSVPFYLDSVGKELRQGHSGIDKSGVKKRNRLCRRRRLLFKNPEKSPPAFIGGSAGHGCMAAVNSNKCIIAFFFFSRMRPLKESGGGGEF